jgi:hypothetical protein
VFGSFVGSGRGHCNAGRCGCEGDWWPRVFVTYGEFCCPTVVHIFDTPQSVLWVAPPSEDGLTVKGDFTAVFVEEDFASGITEDGYREEVVDEAGQPVGEACIGG